jgi:hypothetical protein
VQRELSDAETRRNATNDDPKYLRRRLAARKRRTASFDFANGKLRSWSLSFASAQ